MSTEKINLAGSNPSGVCITFMTYGEFRIPAELSPLASITRQKLNLRISLGIINPIRSVKTYFVPLNSFTRGNRTPEFMCLSQKIVAGLLQVSLSRRFLIKCPIYRVFSGRNWWIKGELNPHRILFHRRMRNNNAPTPYTLLLYPL